MKRLKARFATVFLATCALSSAATAQNAERVGGATNAKPVRASDFHIPADPEWSLDLRTDTSTVQVSIAGAALLRNGIVVVERISQRLLIYA